MGVSNAALGAACTDSLLLSVAELAAFVQNDWKLKPNLTFNLGVRYSLQYPRTEKYDRQGVFLPELAQEFPLTTPITIAGTDFYVRPRASVRIFGPGRTDRTTFFRWSTRTLSRVSGSRGGSFYRTGTIQWKACGSRRLRNVAFADQWEQSRTVS